MTSQSSWTAIPDGYTSAAMLYSYIKTLNPDYPLTYILHRKNKAHGLGEMEKGDFEIPPSTKLLIVPDAGTNDTAECNILINNGISCIIFDHHEAEDIANENKAIIVNNQTSPNYNNKDFSGAGIIYEFLRALDDELWVNYSDKYLDLVALAQISDVMDLRSCPTRYYVNQGLNNIQNPMLKALIATQEYSVKGEISPYSFAWYITPILNSLIRIGSYEERELLFRAFICDYEEFDYKKRTGEIVKESIYERAARLCKNAKARQDKMRDKLFNALIKEVDYDDKVTILEAEEADAGIVGLSAMKLCDAIKRPVIILKQINDYMLGGSCRNFENSPIEDLKDLLNNTGFFESRGHANAAGVFIERKNLQLAKEYLNEQLKDITYDSSYLVDFILTLDDIDVQFIKTLNDLHWLWCTGIKEPLVVITNITLRRKDIYVQGKDNNSVAFECNGIKYVQFKMPEDAPLLQYVNSWGDPEDKITFDVVATCALNDYQGVLQPQCIIKDVQITEQSN